MEGNLRFKIDRASLIVGSKFTVFALFYFVFGGNFPSTIPQGAYIWRGDLMAGFLRYRFGGLIFGRVIHGGAYFRNFTVSLPRLLSQLHHKLGKPVIQGYCMHFFNPGGKLKREL